MPKDTEPVRAAGFVVVSPTPKGLRILLLCNRLHRDWGMPKGHLDRGEDSFAGAKRELLEETGIRTFHLEPGFRHVIRYAVPSGKEAGRTKEVTYFLARVDDTDVTMSEEHGDMRWADPAEAHRLVRHANLRTLLREAVAYLRDRGAAPP